MSTLTLDFVNKDRVESFVARQASPHTKALYNRILGRYLSFVEDNNYFQSWEDSKSGPDILECSVQAFLDNQNPRAKETFDKNVSTIRSFMNWAHRARYSQYQPYLKIRRKTNDERDLLAAQSRHEKIATLLSEAEVRKIIDWSQLCAPRDFIAVLLSWNHALRCSELMSLQRRSFKKWKTQGEETYWMYFGGKTANIHGRFSEVKISRNTYVTVMEYCDVYGFEDDDYLFCHQRAAWKEHWDIVIDPKRRVREPDTVAYAFKKLIYHVLKRPVLGQATHVFRTSRATDLCRRGIDRHEIIKVLRLSSTSTLDKYYDLVSALDVLERNELLV